MTANLCPPRISVIIGHTLKAARIRFEDAQDQIPLIGMGSLLLRLNLCGNGEEWGTLCSALVQAEGDDKVGYDAREAAIHRGD